MTWMKNKQLNTQMRLTQGFFWVRAPHTHSPEEPLVRLEICKQISNILVLSCLFYHHELVFAFFEEAGFQG